MFHSKGLIRAEGNLPLDYHHPGSTEPTSVPPDFKPYTHSRHPSTVLAFTNQMPIFGASPIRLKCTDCNKNILTETFVTEKTPGSAWFFGGVLCCFGLWCIACMPCFCMRIKEVVHTCPNCNFILGKFRLKD